MGKERRKQVCVSTHKEEKGEGGGIKGSEVTLASNVANGSARVSSTDEQSRQSGSAIPGKQRSKRGIFTSRRRDTKRDTAATSITYACQL